MTTINEDLFRYFRNINRLFKGQDNDFNLDQMINIFTGDSDGTLFDVNFGNLTANSLIAPIIGDANSVLFGNGSNLTGISAGSVSGGNLSSLALNIGLDKTNQAIVLPAANVLFNSFALSREFRLTLSVDYTAGSGSISFTTNADLDALLATGMSVEMYIQDIRASSNQEFISIISGSAGSYTLAGGLSNNYTVADNTFASTQTGLISANTEKHDPSTTGQNLKTAQTVEVIGTDSTRSGALSAYVEYNASESFLVNTFTSTTVMKLASVADKSSFFLDSKGIFLYKSQPLNSFNQTWHAGGATNFKYLTLNGNASFGAGEITLTTNEDNSIGTDSTFWSVIPENAFLSFIAGAYSASNLVKMTPKEFILGRGGGNIFADDFNRGDGAPLNDWTTATVINTANNSLPFAIVSNELHVQAGHSGPDGAFFSEFIIHRSKEDYTVDRFYEVNFIFRLTGVPNTTSVVGDVLALVSSDITASAGKTTGHGVHLDVLVGSASFTLSSSLYSNGVDVGVTQVFTENLNQRIRFQVSNSVLRYKIWLASASEPGPWTQEIPGTYDFDFPDFNINYAAQVNESNPVIEECFFDDLSIKNAGGSNVIEYNEPNLTGVEKIVLVATNERQDTTNENPEIVGMAGEFA